MEFKNFQQFRAETFRLYQAGEFARAFELLDRNIDLFPEQAYYTYNWRFCTAALMGEPEKALRLVQEALDKGMWWTAETMHNDPDVSSLQGLPEFERLVNICAERHTRAQASARPEKLVLTPKEGAPQPYPLLVAVHGRSSNAELFAPYWKGLAEQGWMIALPQSSQVNGPNSFAWDDFELAEREISAHCQAICQEQPIDPERIIVAGFSQGGGLAIRLALTAGLPARGFLAVAPFLRETAGLETPPAGGLHPLLRGYMITGGQDQGVEIFQGIENLLQACHIPYHREHHPELGHEFPPDFSASLRKAFDFILG